jgi:peroxiredoxin
MTVPQPGDIAPDFELPAVTGERKHQFKLSDFRGKQNVVLAFYPLDWTTTCGVQLPAMNADLTKFVGLNAQIAAISVDSIPSHIAWQEKQLGPLNYPMLSDFYPHGATAEKYGILRSGAPIPGITERAVFIVDKQGKIAFSHVYELGGKVDHDELFDVLKGLE